MNKIKVLSGQGRVIFTDKPECSYAHCKKPFKNGSTAYYEEYSQKIYCKKCATEGNAGRKEEQYHLGTIKITEQDPDVLLEEETLRRGEHE